MALSDLRFTTRRQALAMAAEAVAVSVGVSILVGVGDTAAAAQRHPREVVKIAIEPLLRLEITWPNEKRFEFVGADGPRSFHGAAVGKVTGTRVNGTVLEHRASDCGRVSQDGRIHTTDARIGIQTSDGHFILISLYGRASPRYKGDSRLSVVFDTDADGPYGWLNNAAALGVGKSKAGTQTVDVFSLDPTLLPAETLPGSALSLDAELLFTRRSSYESGGVAVAPIIRSSYGWRHLSYAAGGGTILGPQLNGTLVAGYAWNANLTTIENGNPIYRICYDNMLIDKNGVPILMMTRGTSGDKAERDGRKPQGSRVMIFFDTPASGPYAFLNEVLAIAVGRPVPDSANPNVVAGFKYETYALI